MRLLIAASIPQSGGVARSGHPPLGVLQTRTLFEFFTVPIRNANTRAAYYRAIQQFLAWVDRAGYQDLEDIEPITVGSVATLQEWSDMLVRCSWHPQFPVSSSGGNSNRR
jgi:hypothetical protein